MEFIILGLIPLGLGVGAVLGWVAFNRTRALEQQLRELQQQLWHLKEQQLYAPRDRASSPRRPPAPAPVKDPPPVAPSPADPASRTSTPGTSTPANSDSQGNLWLSKLKEFWMIWLGGGCIGLAGIFMVRYGIEQGLLGPAARIGLAVVTGLLLHAVAEYLFRKVGPQPAVAALAGGASITLYAALLAALHLYQLMSPGLVFTLLAVISFATMILALRHGPVLAGIGLLGAYVVPALVSSGSNNMTGALIYALIVSTAALCLLRYVYRPWLWYGALAGMVFWGVVSLGESSAHQFRPLYLALLAYALLAIPHLDWRLSVHRIRLATLSWRTLLSSDYRRDQIGLLLLLSLLALSLLQPFSLSAFVLHLPFAAVLLVAARQREDLCPFPWLSAVVLIVISLVPLLSGQSHVVTAPVDKFWAYVIAASLFSVGGVWLLRQSRLVAVWSSLAFLSPVLWLSVTYLQLPELLQGWHWSAITLMLGGAYIFYATQRLARAERDIPAVWLLLAGHAAYSVAVAIAFQEAGLTLALALQLISLSWLIKRYQLQSVDWLVKLLVAVVVTRLTFNPWLLSYADTLGGTHWSLWTYGGATACCVVAARFLNSDNPLRAWLEAAALHLLVLTLGAETRYWLYDGQVFIDRFSYLEAAINVNLWAALALAYHYRGQLSEHLRGIYAVAAKVLLCASLGAFALLLTAHNPYFGYQVVATTPVFNSLLLAYGLPVVMAWLVRRYYLARWRNMAGVVGMVALFVFINLEIRHLWNGDVSDYLPTSSGELYTYSLVWLLIAIGAVLQATRLQKTQLYKVGMCMLLAVIAKIFLVDMSDLAGLLRVASFMGLGLALLGLSYMHKRLSGETS